MKRFMDFQANFTDGLTFLQPRQAVQHYLRNKFNIWNIHGIMSTSGLFQVSEALLYLLFYYKYLIYRDYLYFR